MPERAALGIDNLVIWTLVGVILVAAALTLLPFSPAILWGAILAIDLAPVHARLTRFVGDRHRGVFVGPVVLAVAYDLIVRWIERPESVTDDVPAK
jgi:predicted PurR-regulated permease PerM